MIVRRRTVTQEPPSEQFGPGVIGDFTKVGEATMAVAGGLLTTSDVTQVDALQESPASTAGPLELMLALSTFRGAPTYTSVGNWLVGGGPAVHWPTLYEVTATSDVAGHVGSGGVDSQGNTGVSGNYPGDMLVVRNSGPFISDFSDYQRYSDPPRYGWSGIVPFDPVNAVSVAQDVYVWDGSTWQLAWHWVGPSPVTLAWFSANQGDPANWEIIPVKRVTPADPNIYAYQWTRPGTYADGVRFRVRLRLGPATVNGLVSGAPYSGRLIPGIVMNMADADNGLTWFPWGGPANSSGWTKIPSDLKTWGAHYPPERVQSGGGYCYEGQHPLGGTMYADVGDNLLGSPWTEAEMEQFDLQNGGGGWQTDYGVHQFDTTDIWLEAWRESNTAHAALYTDEPGTANAVATSTFAEDLSGGPYADGAAGYFGIVFSWLNPYAGLVSCEIVEP